MSNLSRVLWSIIGGRPWTYILRDMWHKLEGLWIIGLVSIGALLGHWLWHLIFWFLLVFALGYIAGHLFWEKSTFRDNVTKDRGRRNEEFIIDTFSCSKRS
jgi:hypothetical protein